MITRAALRQTAWDVATPRALLDRAQAIFYGLGTLDEPTRVEAALATLDRGSPIALLTDQSKARPRVAGAELRLVLRGLRHARP
jgi:hypothetical protein